MLNCILSYVEESFYLLIHWWVLRLTAQCDFCEIMSPRCSDFRDFGYTLKHGTVLTFASCVIIKAMSSFATPLTVCDGSLYFKSVRSFIFFH